MDQLVNSTGRAAIPKFQLLHRKITERKILFLWLMIILLCFANFHNIWNDIFSLFSWIKIARFSRSFQNHLALKFINNGFKWYFIFGDEVSPRIPCNVQKPYGLIVINASDSDAAGRPGQAYLHLYLNAIIYQKIFPNGNCIRKTIKVSWYSLFCFKKVVCLAVWLSL